ncbi:MAG: hypothetical protein HGA47_01245 [Zoogloea sp.]|nr:hypothetical protein [Zoogloea sp.]
MISSTASSVSGARPPGSHYVNRQTVRRAVELAMPMLEAAMGDPHIVGSGFLHIVVMDPGISPAEAAFEEAILFEQSLGDRQRWDADYAGFARAKARLSWSLGMDSHRVQSGLAHLLRKGDTLLSGSVWLDGIVVGVSGAFPWFDEAIAGTIAMWLRALARDAREGDDGRLALEAPPS